MQHTVCSAQGKCQILAAKIGVKLGLSIPDAFQKNQDREEKGIYHHFSLLKDFFGGG